MDNGWSNSAAAWVREQGEEGDFARRYVLDSVMLARVRMRRRADVLDVGCGEGRFCRRLREVGVDAVAGIDSTPELIRTAHRRDPLGCYLEGVAELLPFRDASFDLVVSYLSLLDIPDMRAAIAEMARVVRPGGALLIANMNGFSTACGDIGWVRDADGRPLYYPVDRYLDERAMWVAWRDLRILNYHRPMRSYMDALLGAGLRLTYFDEPGPTPDASPDRAERYRRAPWFHVMEWEKAAG